MDALGLMCPLTVVLLLDRGWMTGRAAASVSVRQRRVLIRASGWFVVACGGIRVQRKGLNSFLRVGMRGGSGGLILHLVFVSSSVQGDKGEASLGSGIRDRVDCRIDGGALRYRDGRWRRGQRTRRGR